MLLRPCFNYTTGMLGDYVEGTESWEVTLLDKEALKRLTLIKSKACKNGPIFVKRTGFVFIRARNDELYKVEEEFFCGICQDQVFRDDFITIPCSHRFHNKCFKTWAKQSLDYPSKQLEKMHDSNTKVKLSCPTCCSPCIFRLEKPKNCETCDLADIDD